MAGIYDGFGLGLGMQGKVPENNLLDKIVAEQFAQRQHQLAQQAQQMRQANQVFNADINGLTPKSGSDFIEPFVNNNYHEGADKLYQFHHDFPLGNMPPEYYHTKNDIVTRNNALVNSDLAYTTLRKLNEEGKLVPTTDGEAAWKALNSENPASELAKVYPNGIINTAHFAMKPDLESDMGKRLEGKVSGWVDDPNVAPVDDPQTMKRKIATYRSIPEDVVMDNLGKQYDVYTQKRINLNAAFPEITPDENGEITRDAFINAKKAPYLHKMQGQREEPLTADQIALRNQNALGRQANAARLGLGKNDAQFPEMVNDAALLQKERDNAQYETPASGNSLGTALLQPASNALSGVTIGETSRGKKPIQIISSTQDVSGQEWPRTYHTSDGGKITVNNPAEFDEKIARAHNDYIKKHRSSGEDGVFERNYQYIEPQQHPEPAAKQAQQTHKKSTGINWNKQ